MSTGQSQRRSRTSVRSKPAAESNDSLGDTKPLLDTCTQIGALIIGQKMDRMKQGVEVLQRQASAALLQKHMEVWLPRFMELYGGLEAVLGKVDELSQGALMAELKARVKAAGYPTMRDFVKSVLLPLVSYHGLLLHMNNSAGVSLPADIREMVLSRMNAVNRVLSGACAAMFMQESLGLG